jgi:hypothetical protein
VTTETNGASVVVVAAPVVIVTVSAKVRVRVTNEVMTQPLPAVEELVEDVMVELKNCPKNYQC